MAARAWRKIGSGQIPEREGIAWTQIVESVTPGKLLKIDVPRTQATPPEDQKWKPDIQPKGCTADGVYSTAAPNSAALLPTAPGGCLIARIGGSTVDMRRTPRPLLRQRKFSFPWDGPVCLLFHLLFPEALCFWAQTTFPTE